ncbi:MAG: hypothetical protein HXS46_13185 [Theionarchaea archaeon]|nr:hypothetical protein [Theionarchaea archaeon]
MNNSSSQSNNANVDLLFERIMKNDKLTLRIKKLKYLVLLLPAVLFIIFLGIVMILIEPKNPFGWSILAIPLFFIIFAVFTVNKCFIILNSEGFTIKGPFGSTSYKWADIEEFKVGWSYFFKTVMFRYSDSSQDTSTIHTVIRKLSFNLHTFPDLYTMKAEDLVALMNRLREQTIRSGMANRPYQVG